MKAVEQCVASAKLPNAATQVHERAKEEEVAPGPGERDPGIMVAGRRPESQRRGNEQADGGREEHAADGARSVKAIIGTARGLGCGRRHGVISTGRRRLGQNARRQATAYETPPA